ncbi:MAG: hypothetical protein AB7V27_09115 [Candidatus Binatia bacterium]
MACTACGDVSRDTLRDAAALRSTIAAISGQLRHLAADTAAAGDQQLSEPTARAAREIAGLLPRLDAVLNGAEEDGEAAMRSTSEALAAALGALRAEGAKAGPYASAKLNAALALIGESIDRVPADDLPPFILAMSPTRLDAQQPAPKVKVFGHLPGDLNEDVVVTAAGKPVRASRGPRGAVAFALPPDLALTEGQVVPVHVRVARSGTSSEHIDFAAQLVVGKPMPFSCTVESYEEQPGHREDIAAKKAASYEAASAEGDQWRYVSAADLFAATVEEAAQYEPRTVAVRATGEKVFAVGGGCGDGPSGSARIVAGGRAVELSLSAPRLPRRMGIDGWRIQTCEEGDTRVALTLQPTFSAARRESGVLTPKNAETLAVGFAGAHVLHRLADGAPYAVYVRCDFADGPEQWSTHTMVLTKDDRQAEARGVGARIADDRVVIEPFDPLRFDQQLE